MLAGEPPYTGPTAQAVLAKKLSEPTPRVSVIRERVPATVEAAIDQALAKAPADRLGTASAFVEALTSELVVVRVGGRRWPRYVAGAAAVVVALVAAWGLFLRGGGPTYERLAVLPPANLMNDPEQAYFVQGVHNALISELQRAGVVVIARTSVLQYENVQKPIREIAQELNVDALVEAAVLRAGDSVEIEVKLVDGATQGYVADPIVRRSDLRDIERLYRGLTAAIAAEIHATLMPQAEARLASAREVDPEAYDNYLRGMFHFARLMPGDFDAALGYFERALERDSTYALAYAGIAWVWIGRAQGFAQGGFESIREAQAHAGAAVRRALALDSTLAEVQSAAGAFRAFHEWDWPGGDAAFRKAIQINPNDPVHRAMYSHVLYVTGRRVEGRAQIDSALVLDPADGLCRGFNGINYMFERRYDEAVTELRKALELGNGMGMNVVDVLYLKGARAEALAALRAFYASDQEMLDAVNQGYGEGGYRAAMHRAADVWASRPPTYMGSTFMAAAWYALAEDRERTLDWLERAYEVRDPNIPYAGVDPGFDLVRDDPRFKDLLRRVGLPQ
jgi:TolB-like protein/Tfp pilus assembly protein PilF